MSLPPQGHASLLRWQVLLLSALLFLLSADLIFVPIAGQKIKVAYFLIVATWLFAPRRMLACAWSALRRLPNYAWLPLPPLAISVLLSANPRDSIAWTLWLGFDAFTIVTIYSFLKVHALSGDQVRGAALLAIAAIAACGITQYVAIYMFGHVILQPQFHFSIYRINGVAGWPHFLNIFSFLLLPIVLVQRRLSPASATVLAALVFVLAQSTAKTGWVLFVVLGCLLLALDRRAFTRQYLAFLVPITAISLLVPPPHFESKEPVASGREKIAVFAEDLDLTKPTTSGTDRVLIAKMGLTVWRKHPWFGVGPRAYDDYVFNRFDAELPGENKLDANGNVNPKNENIWIELLAENGILFTLAFAFLVVRALWIPRWQFRNHVQLGAWIALVMYYAVSGQFSQTGLLTLVYAVFGIYFYAGELRPRAMVGSEVCTVPPERTPGPDLLAR